jgi:hypothetical protein
MRRAQDELRALADEGWEARLAAALLDAALRRPGNLGAHWRDDGSGCAGEHDAADRSGQLAVAR